VRVERLHQKNILYVIVVNFKRQKQEVFIEAEESPDPSLRQKEPEDTAETAEEEKHIEEQKELDF